MIKIIKGTYGYQVADSKGKVLRVEPKTSKDEPFALSAEQEARLVRLGVAEYVGAPVEDATEGIDFDKLTVKELRALAEEKGIEVPANAKKNDIILLFLEPEEAEEDEEVPVFDPAEAVE